MTWGWDAKGPSILDRRLKLESSEGFAQKSIEDLVRVSTPQKINMEHNHGGLEDHFPFQMGDL